MPVNLAIEQPETSNEQSKPPLAEIPAPTVDAIEDVESWEGGELDYSIPLPPPDPPRPECVKGNARHIARARYEHNATFQELGVLVIFEIRRMLREGRVPGDVRRFALEACLDEEREREEDGTCAWDTRLSNGRLYTACG